MKRVLISAAILAAVLSTTPAMATTYVGASGYARMGHTGNGCAMVLLTSTIDAPLADGVWFSIDTSSASPLTNDAAAAQVALVSNAASSELLQYELAVNPAVIPKLGLDYNPSAPLVTCAIDEVGDGSVQTIRATNFNYPAGPSQ